MPGHLAEAARTGCKLDVDPQASLRPLVGSSRGCAAELHLREWLSWMGGSETAAADGGHQLALASTSQDLLSPRKPSPGGPGCAGQASSTAGGEEGLRHGPRDGTAARFGQASGPGPGPRKVARLSFLGNGHAAGALARKGHQGQRRATISSPRENVESRDDAYTSISKIDGTRAMEMLRGEPNRTLAPKTMRFKALAEVVEAAMASHRAGQLGNTVLAKRGSHSRRNSIGAPKRRNSTDARLLAPRIEEDALGNLVVRRRASDVRTFLEDPDELFDQFQHDKEMHRDKLQMALERAGVLCVRREWIDEIFEGITKYTVLDREEFEDFVERYQSRVYQEYETAFANCDFKNSRQVPVTSFSNILAFLGVTVTDAVIKDTAKEVDQGNLGQIDMQQLEQFMAMLCLQQGFSKREYTRIMNAFSHFDLDRSSSLDTSEITEILSYLNYAILPDNIANIVKEMGAEEDSQLSRSEFLVFMRKVREFEVTKISECLARPDAPTSKLELLQFAMRSLNYVADLDVIQEVAEEAGIRLPGDANKNINRRPTTLVPQASPAGGRSTRFANGPATVIEGDGMRRASLATTSAFSFDNVGGGDGGRNVASSRRKSVREMRALPTPTSPVRSRGPSKEAVQAAEEEANSAPTLSEVWEFLEVFRAREGFTRVECDEIEAVFGQYLASSDANGEISTLDAGRALQWLGHESPYEVLQQLVSQVDIDGSGRLSLREFKKLVRKHRERQFKQVRSVLEEAGINADQSLVSTQDWKAASMAMSRGISPAHTGDPHNPRTGQLLSGRTSKRSVGSGASNQDVVEAMRTFGTPKGLQRTSFVSSLGGKDATSHSNLRLRFRDHDDDGDGKLTTEQLYSLCLSEYADVHDPALSVEMKKLLDEAVLEASDGFTFKDVQRVMQRFYDWKLKMKLIKEQQVVEGCSFTLTQVRGFREVFNAIDTEANGFISFDAFGSMLTRISPMNNRLAKQLAEVWVRMLPPSQVREGADFPDFLRLMEHLLEENFADIKGKTAHYGLT